MRRDALAQPLPSRSGDANVEKHLWIPDQGNGTYRNPILWADYSDPDVIRVGEDFYLTSSSFNCVPGLPLLHSNDLVNWSLIGHALNELPHPSYDEVRHGCGVWAPTLRFHADKYWIFFSMPDEGIFLTVADDPGGEWSTPHLLHAGRGLIDPCPFWDDDGKAYLAHAYAESRCGIRHVLRIRPMSPDGSALTGEGQIIFHEPARQPTIEGPKLYKRNGYYYVFAPAGGVRNGWQAVLRSNNIYGPYEDRILLAQGDTEINGPHQGAWVDTPAGEHWFIHFQDRGAYGRVVHLQPMAWENDWPVITGKRDGNGIGEPVLSWQKPGIEKPPPIAAPVVSDEFNSPHPGPQWQWPANPGPNWSSLTARPGWLRLPAVPLSKNAVNLWTAPNLLLQKFPAPQFTATTSIDTNGLEMGETAGIIVAGSDYSYVGLQRTATGMQLVHAICKDAANGGFEKVEVVKHSGSGVAQLRVDVKREARCNFSYSDGGDDLVTFSRPFVAQSGKWIGAKIGLFCIAQPGADARTSKPGHADFDWFRV